MSFLARKHADEIREMWQSRALRASTGMMRKIIITALAKEYPAALVTLMRVTFPGFVDLNRPIISSYAHVEIDGSIVCDVIDRDGSKRPHKVFDSEGDFVGAMRNLADLLKLGDDDRKEMFRVLQKWVASDKRVGIMGQKLAS